ncbi:serine protease inhibitor Cvsi-2-like [Ruditapes philippinarum]|uniref:serine protease inhibitor Cvsi-2-like n=1 Tax=Ruditapes philippinarum TaxID=129788 RepID=UPI00295B2982|nr:serine protease inhibitor Cvsi-2-like [Ruditapes philippinarum]
MKTLIALCLIAFAATVYGENCGTVSDCAETTCNQSHGWWLHCTKGMCLCSHDSFTGAACTDGSVATCLQAHGTRCQDNGLNWHCVDGVCHCSRH